MGVTHEPIGKFAVTSGFTGGCDRELFVHERDLAAEVQCQIGRAAIGAKKSSSINCIGSFADIARKVA